MPTTKPFLLLQLRPEDEAADNEAAAFALFGGLESENLQRIRLDKTGLPAIELSDYSGIIVGGGPSNVSDNEATKSPQQQKFERQLQDLLGKIVENDFPFLGACYGIGILAKYLGGKVSKEKYSEGVGAITVKLTAAAKDDPLTKGLPVNFRAFAGHKEACQEVPPGATLMAESKNCPIEMIRVKRNIYATQFHTELDKAGLALRINIYKHAGYFPPEDADMLIAAAEKEEVKVPEKILRGFVSRYSVPA